jgi:hypothetical protein
MLEGLCHVKTLTPSLLCCFEINSDDYWSRTSHWPALFPALGCRLPFVMKGLLGSGLWLPSARVRDCSVHDVLEQSVGFLTARPLSRVWLPFLGGIVPSSLSCPGRWVVNHRCNRLVDDPCLDCFIHRTIYHQKSSRKEKSVKSVHTSPGNLKESSKKVKYQFKVQKV